MMRLCGSAGAIVITTALVIALSGCQKQEGPAEKTGKEIDKAAEKAVQNVDKAGEKLGQELQTAGEKVQEAAKRDKK